MYLVLSVFFALDMIVMTAWSLINPFYPDIEYFPREKPDLTEKDIELLPLLEHCRSQNLYIWYGTYTGYVISYAAKPTRVWIDEYEYVCRLSLACPLASM